MITTSIHAHISKASADCDGRYSSSETVGPTEEERLSQFGEIDFRSRLVADAVSSYASYGGRLDVKGNDEGMVVALDWNETTEEGFRHTGIDFCERDTCEYLGKPSCHVQECDNVYTWVATTTGNRYCHEH